VLEACGRFKEAADLYTEAARAMLGAGMVRRGRIATHLCNAGLAHKRACQWDAAEALYVESLGLCTAEDESGLLSAKPTLFNLVCLYDTVLASNASYRGATPHQHRNLKLENVSVIQTSLMSLLAVAGIDSTHVEMYGTATTVDLLLPAYQSQQTAVRTLIELTTLTDVPSFRAMLLSCGDPTKVAVSYESKPGTREQRAKERRFEARHEARVTARFSGAGQTPKEAALTICAFCDTKWNGMADDQLKRCAGCNKVAYCGRACQRAHWKTHKLSCAKSSAASDDLSMSMEDVLASLIDVDKCTPVPNFQ
jgi:hypothetical protein